MGNGTNAESDTISVFGLFGPTTKMEPILEQLKKMDLSGPGTEISSAFPMMAEPVGVGWRRLKLYHVTLIAGAIGLLFGILLAGGTAALYPLRTGGKPIVSMPIVGIVSFETMMLFAIVTTFITVMVKIVRTRRVRREHDIRIDAGFIQISVQVVREDPRSGLIRTLFLESGAVEVEIQ
jgi:uncharacterized membrane protein